MSLSNVQVDPQSVSEMPLCVVFAYDNTSVLPLQTTPRYIPPEVTDIIISFVPYASTLCKCCLVCRDWVPASRRCLFEEIRLKSEYQYELFVSCVLRSSTMRPWLSLITSLSMSLPYSGSTRQAREVGTARKCARGVTVGEPRK